MTKTINHNRVRLHTLAIVSAIVTLIAMYGTITRADQGNTRPLAVAIEIDHRNLHAGAGARTVVDHVLHPHHLPLINQRFIPINSERLARSRTSAYVDEPSTPHPVPPSLDVPPSPLGVYSVNLWKDA
jgi:hypothetical protein